MDSLVNAQEFQYWTQDQNEDWFSSIYKTEHKQSIRKHLKMLKNSSHYDSFISESHKSCSFEEWKDKKLSKTANNSFSSIHNIDLWMDINFEDITKTPAKASTIFKLGWFRKLSMKDPNKIKDPSVRMQEILENSKKYGVLSTKNKTEFLSLVKKNGKVPAIYRRNLWMLASGAAQAKKSNPDYYIVTENKTWSSSYYFGHSLETSAQCRKVNLFKLIFKFVSNYRLKRKTTNAIVIFIHFWKHTPKCQMCIYSK